MSELNYNIEAELTALEGAKVMDVQGNTRKRRCICLPIDNDLGTIVSPDCLNGDISEVKKVYLNLTALFQKIHTRSQTHLIKPGFSNAKLRKMTDVERRAVPWIGNMRPWKRVDKPDNDW